MRINKIVIGDNGDSSVGINGAYWEIDMKGMEIEDADLKALRAELKEIYSAWSDMGCDYCEFDFEREQEPDYSIEKVDPPNDSVVGYHMGEDAKSIEKQVTAYSAGFTAGRNSEIENAAKEEKLDDSVVRQINSIEEAIEFYGNGD